MKKLETKQTVLLKHHFGASIAIRQVVVVSPGCIASHMSPEFVRIRMPPGLSKCCDKISIVLILPVKVAKTMLGA